MSYGIEATNNQSLLGGSLSKNPNQLDITWFTDCNGYQTTVPFFLEGGQYYVSTANGATVTVANPAGLNTFPGITACSGLIGSSTGVTNNATGYVSFYTGTSIHGLVTPPTGIISKYEFEWYGRTSTAIHTNAVRGAYELGFMDTVTNTAPTFGVYFEYRCDGTTTDTNWMVVFKSASGTTRVSTGVAVAINTVYRMYLSTEISSAGTYTTTYKIKNLTTGTNTEGTASPSSDTHYPTTTSYMASTVINTKAVTATTTGITLQTDYIGTRIRKPLSREILIGG